MKLVHAIFATALFAITLIIVYYIHISYFKVNVVFYAAIADAISTTIIAGSILFLLNYFRPFTNFEKFQLLLIWLFAGYTFAISVPTVIDRSLSFYILEKLQQRGGGIKQDRFEQVFTQEYVKEYRLVDVRLTEQLESGTIVIQNGCVLLTKKGKWIAKFGQFFRTHWLPKQRLLMGQYSDELTDPFRKSDQQVDYSCKPHEIEW